MKLEELLGKLSEHLNIRVIDSEGNTLTTYDGHNSIDESFNDCEVLRIDADFVENEVVVEIIE